MSVVPAVVPTPRRPGVGPALARTILPLLAASVILCFIAITPADADLWGHLTFGRDAVRTVSLPDHDTYSFTSDQAWINHEWLAEVVMWTAYAAGGAAGLVALKLLLACLVGLALLAAWRPRAFPRLWRDALLCAAALGTWPQLQSMRPQAFSLALFAWLLVALERARDGQLRWLIAVPPIFAVWVNVHGGWVVGAAALLAFTVCLLFDRAWSWGKKAALAATSAVALAATLCNPYGTAMLAFLADTVRPGRSDIIEWHAVTALGPVIAVFWVVPALLAAIVLWRKPRVPVSSLLITLLLAVGAIRVARLTGFFTIAVAILLVPHLRKVPATTDSKQRRRRSTAAAVATCLAASACALALFGRHISADAPWLPEPHAVAFVRAEALRGRMLTWFDYGQYAIWHLAPDIRVSMDGRRETVYSERMRAMHARIYSNAPSAIDDVARLRPDYVWLPHASPVVPTLEANGWLAVFDGPRSVILARSATRRLVREYGPVPPRWFPGP